jgi:CRP-like cAMP-binding protein/rubredoxin
MPKWQCVECGYFVQEANRPPDVCPSCSLRCSFTDVTCYRPECGGPVNPDPSIMKAVTSKNITPPLRPTTAKEEAQEEEVVYGEKARMATLFHGVPEKEMQKILSIGETMVCEPGTVLFRAEDDATTMYFIQSGRVAVQVKEGETEKTVYTASEGDVLGWSTVVLPYQRTATAVVVEKAKVVAIDTNKFQDFCDKNAAMCYRVAQNLNRAVIARLRFAKAAGLEEVYG